MNTPWWVITSLILNGVLVAIGVVVFVIPGAHFVGQWDGPTLATLVLTAATVMLGAVAVIAGMLAIWGFTTLREHAGNIAQRAASSSIQAAAEAAAERVVKKWLGWPEDGAADDIAQAYGMEE